MFQEIDSNDPADMASCLLDMGLKLDSKITKMIFKANSKSSFTLRMLILTQSSSSNKLEFIFLQIVPPKSKCPLPLFRVDPALGRKRTLSCKGGLIASLPWFSSGCPIVQRSPGSTGYPGLEHCNSNNRPSRLISLL